MFHISVVGTKALLMQLADNLVMTHDVSFYNLLSRLFMATLT